MKKVININFQGRVIPIEETAYELLKQYIESLRIYFAKEEGRDEIINDIEGRIAELFSERLKGSVTCITDDDVNSVIAGMGRPSDFEAEEGETASSASSASTSTAQPSQAPPLGGRGRGRLYRNADDKIIGGVCSGLANYMGIDPVIMRILFVVFLGVLFWVYILLWIIVPSKSIESNITKRLYRSADQRVIGGVAGGLAAYFNIDVWIPRLIFALPFIIGLISGGFNSWMWDWDFGFAPRVISGSFSGTLFITYIILWIAVPVAHTAAEKLEMRGEKVNLNSIANTVKEDLEQFKTRAEKWGEEMKSSAKEMGSKAKNFSTEATYAARQAGNGLGHAIGVLFKVFFIFIFTIIAVSLFSVFVALLFGGLAVAPLKDFILEGPFQNSLTWITLFLFFMIPLVALITWGVRRIMGVRTKRHYLGYIFAGLWVIGLIGGIALVGSVARNFRNYSRLPEENIGTIENRNRVFVDVKDLGWRDYNREFFGIEVDDDWPWYTEGEDSILLNTVKITMAKSNDSAYHVYRVRESRGSAKRNATQAAERIEFSPTRMDSVIELPQGFYINKVDKFRNQRVWIVIEVPVGKRIGFSRDIGNYHWFNMHNRYNRWDEYDNQDDYDYWKGRPEGGQEYIMRTDGPERIASL
ncbi:MAG: PspC domain-containing protein [Chitinophagaceae bacterium]|nr:PspC domain-containing protein [Chitinophagaceae bacterium]